LKKINRKSFVNGADKKQDQFFNFSTFQFFIFQFSDFSVSDFSIFMVEIRNFKFYSLRS